MRIIINNISERTYFVETLLIVLGSGIAIFVFDIYRQWYNALYEKDLIKIKEQIHLQFREKMQLLNYQEFDSTNTYEKIQKCSNLLDSGIDNYIRAFMNLLDSSTNLITIISLILFLDPIVTFCIIILSIILFFKNKKTGELSRNKYENSIFPTKKSKYFKLLTLNKDYIKESRVYPDLENVCRDEYIQANNDIKINSSFFAKKILSVGMIGSIFRLLLENIFPWSFIVWKSFTGKIAVGDAVSLLNATGQLPWQVAAFIESSVQVKVQSTYIEDIRFVWEYHSTIEKSDRQGFTSLVNSVEFRNVAFSYNNGIPVIKNMSFQLQRGRRYAFIGRNGAGKSTILKLLCRLYDVDNGEILINDHNITHYNVKSIRKRMSLLFQDFIIYPFTVAQNVALEILNDDKLNDNLEKAVSLCLKKAGMVDFDDKLQQGIYTVPSPEYDKNGQFLSGGQSQKIAIARAIYDARDVIIFDEPSASLDPLSEKAMIDLIYKLASDKILLCVTHSMRIARSCDCILFIDDGSVIEQGTHDELIAKKGAYYEFYVAQETDI